MCRYKTQKTLEVVQNLLTSHGSHKPNNGLQNCLMMCQKVVHPDHLPCVLDVCGLEKNKRPSELRVLGEQKCFSSSQPE